MMIWILLFALFGIVISIWNAYASGYNSVQLRRYTGKFSDFLNIANSFSLVLAFAGATYYTALIIGIVAAYLNYISIYTLQALYSLNFLVFGGLITFTGIVITVNSVLTAYYTKNWKNILIAIWNIFASIWNVFTYVSNFITALGVWEGADERDRSRAVLIIAIAVVIGIVLTYFAYKFGKEQALRGRWQGYGGY